MTERELARSAAPHSWDVSPAQARACFWILFVSSLLITKIGAICESHAIQVPLVRWLNDRSLYPHDPFMAVLARYPSGLWPLVALLARVFPLEGTLLSLFVLERLFVLYAASRLGRALAPGSGLAVVGATALFAFPIDSLVGSGTIVEVYLEQTALAIPCLLLAAAAFHERRRVAWAVWLAVAFDLTPMYGAFGLSYFGAVFAFDPEYRGEWRNWGRPFLLLLSLISYGLYLSVSAARGPSPDETGWLVAARARCDSHFYPLTWGWRGFTWFAEFLALFAVILALVRREIPRLARHGGVWSVVACLWLIDAFVAPYVLESRPLMMMQPARATDLLLCFGGIAMICAASRRLDARPGPGGRRGWVIALGASFLVWRVPGTLAVAALLTIVVLPPVWRSLSHRLSPRRLAWLLIVWVALVGIDRERVRWLDARALVFRGPGALVRGLAVWAEENTAVDAVFLLDASAEPDFNHFMGLAGRSIFTSTEEGTALYWAPDFVTDWVGRLHALGMEVEYRSPTSLEDDFSKAFDALDDEHVTRLAQRYRVSHWVVPRTRASRFRVAWDAAGYKVLEVP